MATDISTSTPYEACILPLFFCSHSQSLYHPDAVSAGPPLRERRKESQKAKTSLFLRLSRVVDQYKIQTIVARIPERIFRFSSRTSRERLISILFFINLR